MRELSLIALLPASLNSIVRHFPLKCMPLHHNENFFARFALFISIIIFLAIFSSAQTIKNMNAESNETPLRAAIRSAICKAAELTVADCADDFKYVSREIDLNCDGKSELIVWVPSEDWGGTSGYPIAIFSRTKNGYQKLWTVDQAWTPIIVLKSKSHGWQDIAFQFGGGGVKFYYQTLRFNGRTYNYSTTAKKEPTGQVVFDKDFNSTVLGPTLQQ